MLSLKKKRPKPMPSTPGLLPNETRDDLKPKQLKKLIKDAKKKTASR